MMMSTGSEAPALAWEEAGPSQSAIAKPGKVGWGESDVWENAANTVNLLVLSPDAEDHISMHLLAIQRTRPLTCPLSTASFNSTDTDMTTIVHRSYGDYPKFFFGLVP